MKPAGPSPLSPPSLLAPLVAVRVPSVPGFGRAVRCCALLLSFGLGCGHRVLVSSDPPGAEVMVGRRSYGVTPVEVKISPLPWRTREIKVRAPGRRTVTFKVPRWRFRSEHEVVLVRRHGRAGSWAPEDAEP